jgi:hypothetical protein
MLNRLAPAIVIVSLLFCGNVMAATNNPLPPKGKIGSGNQDGGNNNKTTQKKDTAKKADLPPPADIPALDTAKFDQIVKELSLTDDQLKRVDSAKASVEEEIKKLANAQKDARAAYDKADNDGAAAAAAMVMRTAAACKSFNPNQRFEDTASGIMTQEQRAKYRQELKKS